MGLLICGLNGSGKSTVGKILADRLGYQFIDNEELYFPNPDSDYSYSTAVSKDEVIHSLEERIKENARFVFSAVKGDYGDKLISSLDYIVLIETPREIRLRRVYDRSFRKYGERILSGGDLFKKESEWFSRVGNRPEEYVTEWLATIDCPVIRIDGTLSAEENVDYLITKLNKKA